MKAISRPESVVIVGGGPHALCLLDLLSRQAEAPRVLGYLDRERTDLDAPYLGDDEALLQGRITLPSGTLLLMGIGINTRLRERVFGRFREAGFGFMTLIDPSAVVSASATIGQGTVIFPQVVIGARVELSENVMIHSGSVIEHETHVGSHTYISPGAIVPGRCGIGRGVMLGAGCRTLEGLEIASGSVIGAGAVVIRSITTDGHTWVGVPARDVNPLVTGPHPRKGFLFLPRAWAAINLMLGYSTPTLI